ncbi:acetyl-CoA carboxylase carboxyltransferase subunit beta [Phragmitibacter flavus]|uniref:Acetyl-coenzyme A carboxylase carboxyl transferase subunit beta n=1 Tax=Phragmitibacter flavus TaxID=2576071 RepID=A0A5R8KHU6_9BACT|nr:acetyl-CoA carboxylase, carboxyltransferase subunit beta [Phragmitibacter flavus]TLD71810.1 acetyl-CoA carboxylase carboxyltransferase subunit beta [Phragmitibacter flavus]
MGFFKKRSLNELGEKKKDMPEGVWVKCPSCGESLYDQTLAKNMRVCTHCSYHFTLSAAERLETLVDEESFEEIDAALDSVNPLGFDNYLGKVKAYQAKTGLTEAVVTGRATIGGHRVVLAIMDFRFLGASMGSVVGEKITRAIETATTENRAVIVFSASGGARMHEGILSLMQMAKTCGALARHHDAKLPYISVLTHPTTGGVTASFATVGDLNLAEPKCMIGFAGPRVVKETTHSDLPPGFQTAEFLKDHGLIDMIVPRHEMQQTLARVLGYLLNGVSR